MERWSIRSTCWACAEFVPVNRSVILLNRITRNHFRSGEPGRLAKQVTQHPKLVIRSALSIRWSSGTKCFTKFLSSTLELKRILPTSREFFASTLQRSATLTKLPFDRCTFGRAILLVTGTKVRTSLSICLQILRPFFPLVSRDSHSVSANKKVSVRTIPSAKAPAATVQDARILCCRNPIFLASGADVRLVARCKGAASRWPGRRFTSRFTTVCRPRFAPFWGRWRTAASLVDEIAARVWYALVRNDFELLGRFDFARGCPPFDIFGRDRQTRSEAAPPLRTPPPLPLEQGASKVERHPREAAGDVKRPLTRSSSPP